MSDSLPPTLSSVNPFIPLIIQQYERYLPSAFDDSLSMLQKVNNVINSLNTLGDNFNTVVEQWNNAISWVEGEGLTQAVDDLLNQWLTDGTLYDLINQNPYIIYARDHGVKGDGTTDDAPAIQSLVNTLTSVGGGIIVFDGGNYLLNSSITLTNNLTIQGITGKTVFNSGNNNELFYSLQNTNVIFKDLILNGPVDLVHIQDGNNIQFHGCSFTLSYVSGNDAACIVLERVSGSNVGSCKDFIVKGCFFHTSFIGVLVQGKTNIFMENILIEGNNFTATSPLNIAGSGELVKIDYYSKQAQIIGNKFFNTQLSGITIEENTNEVIISNNLINIGDQYGIRLAQGQTAQSVTHIVITDNILLAGKYGIFSGDLNVNQSLIKGNIFDGQSVMGMYYWVNSDFEISHNLFTNVANFAMHVRGQGGRIAQNRCEGMIKGEQLQNSHIEQNTLYGGGNLNIFKSQYLVIQGNHVVDANTPNGGITLYGATGDVLTGFKVFGNFVESTLQAYGIYADSSINDLQISHNYMTGYSSSRFYNHAVTSKVLNDITQMILQDVSKVNYAITVSTSGQLTATLIGS